MSLNVMDILKIWVCAGGILTIAWVFGRNLIRLHAKETEEAAINMTNRAMELQKNIFKELD